MLGAFYLAVGGGYFVALLWSFWANTLPTDFLVAHAPPRLVIPLSLIAVAAILHLSGVRTDAPIKDRELAGRAAADDGASLVQGPAGSPSSP